MTSSDKAKNLAARLQQLGVRSVENRRADAGTERLTMPLAGEWQHVAGRRVFIHRQTLPETARRGAQPLTWHPVPDVVAAWAGAPSLVSLSASDFVFLDTETSGLAGGTGTYAFLVGVARWRADGLEVAQFFMPSPADEPALLQALADFVDDAQAVVSFNGKTFDGPLLRTRYRLQRLSEPFAALPHLDVLFLARRIWRDRLPSRSLQALESAILGVRRSADEVPGNEIPYLYFDYLRTSDAGPLQGVFYHNAEDVITLAQLLALLNGWLAAPWDFPEMPALDLAAAARLFEAEKRYDEAVRLYELVLARNDLPEDAFWLAVKRLAVLQRRLGNRAAALPLWERAAAQRQVYAMVELAKHAEHRLRDVEMALRWVTRAESALQEDDTMPPYRRHYWQEDLARRRQRLERRARRI